MKKLMPLGTVFLILMVAVVPAFAAGTTVGDPDIGVLNIDATTNEHYYAGGTYPGATDPEAWAWNHDLWTLNVAVDCEATLRISWFDGYPTNDVYDLYLDSVLKGTNPAGGTGSVDVLLDAGTHTVKVDWIYYQTNQLPISGGSYYDITFETISYSCTPPTGEITKPAAGETVYGPVLFEALYVDNDPLGVQWAVRYGTCATGANTVFGNVDDYSDAYAWDGILFQATADTSTWAFGDYCFVFNPVEGPGEPNMRLTREFTLGPIPVDLDIKPGSDPNCFNSNEHGVIPVAILGSATFDASTIDPVTVTLDSQAVKVKGKSGNAGSLEDVNGDGFIDLVVQITDEGEYSAGDTSATVTGQTYAGYTFEGSDSICIRPPE